MLKATNALKSIANIYIYIYRAALSLLILCLSFAIIGLSSSTPASAATLNYSVDIMPTLSLNLSSANISLKLNPVSKTFDSTNLDVSVATNNLNGYKLYLNTIEDTTSLTRQNDGTSADSLNATIETLP
ncbi:hypothetical protein IKF23_01340, partial [Candidatus Saccharibacteria bacterium]|nr:hypothetical protein [Candidatus Saccharibacteria bacterium]